MEVLFTLLSDRYEQRSVCLSTNLVLSEWERIFKNPLTTVVVSSDDQLQGPLLRSSELTAIIYWMYRAKQRSSYIMAAIDRVIHHCVILDLMAVDSYRAHQATLHQLPQREEATIGTNT
jgi:IstB-like ATP binding protein